MIVADLVPAADWYTATALAVAVFVSGVFNTGAVGGSLLSFLALHWIVGLDPLTANGTNIALIAFAFLPVLATPRVRSVGTLAGVGPEATVSYAMIAGKTLGLGLLAVVSAGAFTTLAPWLLGSATVLLALTPWLRRRLPAGRHAKPRSLWVAPAATLVVGVYAGFFAGATGTLLLAVLAVTTTWPVDRLNDIKNFTGAWTTVIGLLVLLCLTAVTPVAWGWVALLAVPMLLGGWVGLVLAARMPRPVLLAAVVGMSAVGTVFLAVQG